MKSTRLAVFSVLLAIVAAPVFGQQFRADGKITGDAFRHYQARTYQRHARDYSQMLYYQGRGEQPLNSQTAKPQASQIRRNVEAASKALDAVKESPAAKPDVQKSIEKIKERHARVLAKCDELDTHLTKDGKDTSAMCDCCIDIVEELDGADAELDKLMKDLRAPELPKPTRSAKAPTKPAVPKK